MIKVFAMNDCDWVAAETAEDAVALYMKETGLSREEALEGKDQPDEMTEAQMLEEKFLAYEEDDEGDPLSPTTRTFREELDRRLAAGETFPCFFASTEH